LKLLAEEQAGVDLKVDVLVEVRVTTLTMKIRGSAATTGGLMYGFTG
jgi:hypothetical protein